MAPKTRSQISTTESQDESTGAANTSSRRVPAAKQTHGADTPPSYTIDLSLLPECRYLELVSDFKDEISQLVGLFDEVAANFLFAWGVSNVVSISMVKRLAGLLLRRVYSDEQTRELRGISSTTGVDMYLLVAFNVVLDLMMGCSSGGVRISEGRMVHFRTLDWGMDALRRVVVQLDFVRREGGPVVATSVTYAGFVGVLTGVRQGLSASLNFRGLHNDSESRVANARYTLHQILVLLGVRPSIGCLMREMILPSKAGKKWALKWRIPNMPTIEWLSNTLPSVPTTACYLIFCTGRETLLVEKDRITAVTSTSKAFLAATNHDVEHEEDSGMEAMNSQRLVTTGMQEIISESVDRKGCLEACYRKTRGFAPAGGLMQTNGVVQARGVVQMADVQNWLRTYPIVNECTHYAVIMDPENREISWLKRWRKPYRQSK
jgi:hypothetical protein